ncbi:MAG: pro-sigmaK processing inhibitor BofA family protein [Clostridia bacterium]|nr:pro-sigmaK processing inhibitor BofA family protein [Clostridia bacterium]
MHGACVAAAVVCAAVVAGWVLFHAHGIRSWLLSALQGVAALFAVNLVGLVSGVTIALNGWSLGAAALLGMPGVIGALLLQFLLR